MVAAERIALSRDGDRSPLVFETSAFTFRHTAKVGLVALAATVGIAPPEGLSLRWFRYSTDRKVAPAEIASASMG